MSPINEPFERARVLEFERREQRRFEELYARGHGTLPKAVCQHGDCRRVLNAESCFLTILKVQET